MISILVKLVLKYFHLPIWDDSVLFLAYNKPVRCKAIAPTSNATFNVNTGRLVIPNLAVSMTAPFGGAEQIFNYGIEMQQRTGAFVFDLDLSKVVQR